MKRKNEGLSTVEIIIAAVLIVAVIVGALIAIKSIGGNKTNEDDKQSATKIVDSLLTAVDGYVKSADLDINYDEKNYIRFVGRNKVQVYRHDAETKQVYFVEKSASEFGSTDEAIREAVKAYAPEVSEMSVAARNVETFYIELVNQDTLEGKVKTTVRAAVGSESIPKTQETALNSSAIAYFAERAGHTVDIPTVTPTPTTAPTSTPTPKPTEPAETPTPKPTEPAATPTPTEAAATPTPTEPAATPTPTEPAATPTPDSSKVHPMVENPEANTGFLAPNRTVWYTDAILRVYVERTSEDTEFLNGSTIGGIGMDDYNPDSHFLFVLDHDPEMNEMLYFDFDLQELKDWAKMAADAQSGAGKKWTFKVNDDSGYSFRGVDVIER